MKYKWQENPFPHIVIDNFLDKKDFDNLVNKLETNNLKSLKEFNSKLEKKTIFHRNESDLVVNNLIERFSSDEFKNIISSKTGKSQIYSQNEPIIPQVHSFIHVTYKKGKLGSHVDHSSINNGEFIHVANCIFYASSKWDYGWGGETVLFSRNGYIPVKKLEPKPNRLLIFIHTSNSFHGVTAYNPLLEIPRKTFYHDYYCHKKDIKKVLKNLNNKRQSKLKYFPHSTTFIPFLPNGINNFSLKDFFDKRHISYCLIYFIYLINGLFKIDLYNTIKKFFFKK